MTSNPKAEELLPPATADRGSGVRLTQTKESSSINRRGRSTYPQKKSVRKSGATPGRKLLIVWDGLQAHRSKLVRGYIDSQSGAIAIERRPAYAPELNPVEYIWGYLKHHAMPNYCAADLGDVADRARRNLRSMQRRPTLVRAFWQQAELF